MRRIVDGRFHIALGWQGPEIAAELEQGRKGSPFEQWGADDVNPLRFE